MTWGEITQTLQRGCLDCDAEGQLWVALFQRREEVAELIEHLRARQSQRFVLPMILMAAHTGARRSGIVRSQLDDFDFHTDVVRLREKMRSRKRSVTFRYVPMTDEMRRRYRHLFPDQQREVSESVFGKADMNADLCRGGGDIARSETLR